jgi:hypothetical protein
VRDVFDLSASDNLIASSVPILLPVMRENAISIEFVTSEAEYLEV